MSRPISIIITLLHTRDCRYWGFRYLRCVDGAMVEGKISGGESNIRCALAQDDDGAWRNDYATFTWQVTEKALEKLPHAGCAPDDIRAWVMKRLPMLPDPERDVANVLTEMRHHLQGHGTMSKEALLDMVNVTLAQVASRQTG